MKKNPALILSISLFRIAIIEKVDRLNNFILRDINHYVNVSAETIDQVINIRGCVSVKKFRALIIPGDHSSLVAYTLALRKHKKGINFHN